MDPIALINLIRFCEGAGLQPRRQTFPEPVDLATEALHRGQAPLWHHKTYAQLISNSQHFSGCNEHAVRNLVYPESGDPRTPPATAFHSNAVHASQRTRTRL